MHQPFFPAEIFEDYFNPKRKKKGEKFSKIFPIRRLIALLEKKSGGKKIALDELAEDDDQVFYLPLVTDILTHRVVGQVRGGRF